MCACYYLPLIPRSQVCVILVKTMLRNTNICNVRVCTAIPTETSGTSGCFATKIVMTAPTLSYFSLHSPPRIGWPGEEKGTLWVVSAKIKDTKCCSYSESCALLKGVFIILCCLRATTANYLCNCGEIRANALSKNTRDMHKIKINWFLSAIRSSELQRYNHDFQV